MYIHAACPKVLLMSVFETGSLTDYVAALMGAVDDNTKLPVMLVTMEKNEQQGGRCKYDIFNCNWVATRWQ
jgi:hypothetical protein